MALRIAIFLLILLVTSVEHFRRVHESPFDWHGLRADLCPPTPGGSLYALWLAINGASAWLLFSL